MSVICARCSNVLRSSGIIVRDVSVRAGLAYPLGMTKGQEMRRRMTETLDISHLGTLFRSFAILVHRNSRRFLDFARNDRDSFMKGR
jgi:hypothetical protein